MSAVDISRLFRIVQPLILINQELQSAVTPLIQAADSDGQVNAEDHTLTDSEAQTYLGRLRLQSQRGLNLLTTRREDLVGSIESATRTMSMAQASEELLALLELAAGEDQDLTAEEVDQLIALYDQQLQAAREMSTEGFMENARAVVRGVEALQEETPEAFVSTDREARRRPIDLNFLKSLPPTVFAGGGEQAQALQQLLQSAGIEPQDRNTDWSMSFEEVEAFRELLLQNVPSDQQGAVPTAEVLMANLRFTAFLQRDEINAQMGRAVVDGSEASGGVNLHPLIERQGAMGQQPYVELLIRIAGEDGILTLLEIEQHIQRMREENPGFELDPAVFLASARQLVEDLGSVSAEDLEAGGPLPAFSRDQYLNELVLSDLRRMREGFSHRDAQMVEEDSIPNFMHFATWAFTFGGLTTSWLGAPNRRESDILPCLGPTYLDIVREGAEAHDSRRGRALAQLERILEGRDPEFNQWLESRPEGRRAVNEPNALEFLRTAPDSYPLTKRQDYEILTGSFFQADRLWRIRSIRDVDRQEAAWLQFALNLRNGYWTFQGEGQTQNFYADNLDFARAILHALYRESTNPEMRSRVHTILQDSEGLDITDEAGNVIEEGNGEFGIWPPDWFRNYSDENVDGAITDGVLLVATFWMGGGIFTRVGTSVGRSSLFRGALSFLGVRATGAVASGATGVAAQGAATASNGIFRNFLVRMIGRRVAAAEARVAALAQTGGYRTVGRAAEREAATTALERARAVQRILTAPLPLRTQAAMAVAGRAAPIVQPVVQRWTQRLAAAEGRWWHTAAVTSLNLGGRSLRLTGRFLKYLSYEGIVTYGIAGYLFESMPRHSNHPLIFDREYAISLPDREEDEADDTDQAEDSAPVDPPAPNPSTADDSSDRLARSRAEDDE